MTKPIKHAISVVIRNSQGQTLFALRSPKKKNFPLIWSLPSFWVADSETPEATIARIGAHKLGVKGECTRLYSEYLDKVKG